MLIKTFFINKTCMHVQYEGCSLRRATVSFKQSRGVPPLPPDCKAPWDRDRLLCMQGSSLGESDVCLNGFLNVSWERECSMV